MPLPALFSIPPDTFGWDSFVWWNWQDHLEITEAILKQKGISLPTYPMAAMDTGNIERWTELNSQAHTDMMNAVGVPSRDLDQFDPTDPEKLADWLFFHAMEHRDVRSALAI